MELYRQQREKHTDTSDKCGKVLEEKTYDSLGSV